MGTVYLAEQLEPIRRRVALKVVKLGMDTAQVLARFNNERQALAMMDHLNIAQIFDAGATAKGRPYFVMEYIEGAPITQYCDSKRITIKARLALFLAVCRAVQHAHQKGVIHRDLKASNILVAGEGPGLWLIDLVGVRRYRRLPRRRRVQNLARLNASFLGAAGVTRTARLRFLLCYLGPARDGWKYWWRRVDAATWAKVRRNRRRVRPLA